MHDLVIRTKDGKERCGWLWTWRPLEGYFEMGDQEDGEVHRIELDDLESAGIPHTRVSVSRPDDTLDLLEKARKEGWKAKETCHPGS